MSLLDEILGYKRSQLPALRERLRSRSAAPASPRPVELKRSAGEPLRLITEIKRRSPSAGQLSVELGVEQRAQAYADAGSALISVLCDERYFDGDYEHLEQARSACSAPLLCKEFVLDECQLDAARAYGADAVLLIVRCLPGPLLERLLGAARERELTPLVEVFSSAEAERALDAGASWIGVNARDLDTLRIDTQRAERILRELPSTITRIHLSGVKTADDVRAIARGPADAALIGECLMRQDDPGPLLRQLVAAGS